MRRWETFAALAAVVLASIGSIPRVPFRLAFTLVALALITAVGVSRLATALSRKPKQSLPFDPAERARVIREKRTKRR
jgi:hypothetical protein